MVGSGSKTDPIQPKLGVLDWIRVGSDQKHGSDLRLGRNKSNWTLWIGFDQVWTRGGDALKFAVEVEPLKCSHVSNKIN
jgi:hypothetical protein